MRIKKNDEVDVGSIPVKIFYHTVKVLLQDGSGNPLLKSATAWRSVAVRILDERKRFVAETSVSPDQFERVVSRTDSGVTLALPQGVWYIKISPDENSSWLTSEKPVHLMDSVEQLTVILKEQ
ncbi:MAG: hypothetical protein JOZ96_23560 [Acidobacteria bacterium]|nr:hypothetical protein [Acidobacteriota bacterium]